MDGWNPLSGEERSAFQRDGHVVLRGVVGPEQRRRLEAAADLRYRRGADQGELGPDDELHARGVVLDDPAFVEVLDHGPVFRWIWGLLGWNVYTHHSHLDVNPPVDGPTRPRRWGWHQDGWRQNSDAEELDADGRPAPARPRFSIKACYVLSDLSSPGRGATLFLPGSHEANELAQPPNPECYEHPVGARELLAEPGDVLLFDRRLWHSRSRNVSDRTRKVLFIAYTYRWIRPLDLLDIDRRSRAWKSASPLQRQLLGVAPDAADYWGIHHDGGIDDEIPLRSALAGRGLLDRSIPWLR